MSFDPEPFVRHYREANAREEALIAERAARALDEAKRLAREIRAADQGVRGVILFGSLAEGGPRRIDFDIDLALEGGDLYRALDIVEDSSFDVDLVSLERLHDHVRARILEKGIRLA
jgi:predicted nucleotidyltransferase